MLNFGIDSKLYKYSNYVYNLLKLNFFVMISFVTIVGLGSGFATGFYQLNQLTKKSNDVNFLVFLKHFKLNFRKGLSFSAPFIFIIYLVFKNFAFEILKNPYAKYSFFTFLVLMLSFMFTLLIVTGLVESDIKNTIIYAFIIYTKQLFALLFSTIFLGIIFKSLLFRFPIILMLFSFVIVLSNYYIIFRNIINKEKLLQGEKN